MATGVDGPSCARVCRCWRPLTVCWGRRVATRRMEDGAMASGKEGTEAVPLGDGIVTSLEC